MRHCEENLSSIEMEVSVAWKERYPKIFSKMMNRFYSQTIGMMNFSTDISRNGFVTYKAWK
jgi:hypothetical protein